MQLRDWTALVHLPAPRSPVDVQELFYPHAPADVLDRLELNGHLYRRVNFLGAPEHSSYNQAYQYVLEHPEQVYADFQAILRSSMRDGEILSQVMLHVVQWLNVRPIKVASRVNNKPPLWRDFVSALRAAYETQAEDHARHLQREIFTLIRDHIWPDFPPMKVNAI